MTPPEALILAGPNGAGKTTSSAVLVPAGTRFLNADVIVDQLLREGILPGGADVAAGRVLLGQLRTVVAAGEPFCIETNLAGQGMARRIDEWHAHGYVVRLVFTALDSPELALQRVAARAASGGHDVPPATVRRRWKAGLRALFDLYLPIVERWIVLDSSDGPVRQVAAGGEGTRYDVLDQQRWRRLLTLAAAAGSSAVRPGGEFFDPVPSIDDDGEPQP